MAKREGSLSLSLSIMLQERDKMSRFIGLRQCCRAGASQNMTIEALGFTKPSHQQQCQKELLQVNRGIGHRDKAASASWQSGLHISIQASQGLHSWLHTPMKAGV